MSKRLDITISAPLPDDQFEAADRQVAILNEAKKLREALGADVTFDIKTVTVPARAPKVKATETIVEKLARTAPTVDKAS